ncbi:MAG: pyrimidine 5'-nucleotidase [Betaproteobacteria bacterium]|nr:pyrimidine 5'-nucleotidase [Betaproteobacteria bacterium]
MRIVRLPPRRRVWIFDLDNTLHDASARIFPAMHVQINDYIRRHLGLDEAGANALRHVFWQRYGTTMKGLMRRYGTDPRHFLHETHRFPGIAEMVVSENALKHALSRLDGQKIVFTNAPRRYAEEVLAALGLARWFDAVYTIEDARYRGKPEPHGFHRLLRLHDLDAHRCAMIDDSLDNLRAAKRLGMSTVWVSRERRATPHVDLRVASVVDLPRYVFRHA